MDEVDARREENKIIVWDGDNELVLEEASNIDTLVISRLGVQGELDAEHAVKVLQDRGILVLNPVYYSSIACNKYETAKLLEAAKIPQPRFCYMTTTPSTTRSCTPRLSTDSSLRLSSKTKTRWKSWRWS